MEEILNYLAERIGIVSFLVGIIFTVTSIIMLRFPPKKINYFYGYRTTSSMKNQEIWDFSQKYSAVKMFQIGLFLLAVSFINLIVDINQEQATILGIALMILACIYMMIMTEKAIKMNFPNQ
ncbi:SdpI family protein [Flavobacterium sp. AS60]|uniref:SdpI family protein n=1 Tax=Flavobacterium anseongense TaxID=2910677 RepID=UPI001F2A5899|nr:SdpI family protein [Flavobacterium sp. AS60]MCF6129793.1 SdpI family protein [Flavobacterium sp. AS60]